MFLLSILANIGAFAAVLIIGALSDDPLRDSAVMPVVFTVIGLLTGVLQLVAILLITVTEPPLRKREPRLTLRRAARILIVGASVGTLFETVAWGWETAHGASSQASIAWSASLQLFDVAALVTTLLYLHRFTRRIPSTKLGRRTMIVCWGLGLSYGIGMVANVGLVIATADHASLHPMRLGQVCVQAAPYAIGMFFTVWLVLVLASHRRAFADAIRTVTAESGGEDR